MSFTATGPLLLLLVAWVFLFRPRRLAEFAVFFAPFSATAIVNLSSLGYKAGGLGLTPAMAFILLFFAAQLIYAGGARAVAVGPGHLVQLGLLTLFAATAILSLLLNGAQGTLSSYQLTQTTYLCIGLLATVLLSLEFAGGDGIDRAVRVARLSAIFVSAWGLLQLGCSVLHVPYPGMLFNNSNSDSADMFAQSMGGFARIASVAVEPSVMAASLLHFAAFGTTLLSREARLRTRYWIGPTALTVGVLVLSTSSTAYVGLLVLAVLILCERPGFAVLVGVPAVTALLAVVALVPRALEILLAATVNKSASGSYLDRASLAAADLAQFVAHPLIGSGWGRAANMNAAWALLCNVGLLGTVVFLAAGAFTLASLSLGSRGAPASDWRLAAYAAGVRNALIVAAVCGVTSGMKYVFLTVWVFWGLGIAVASRLERAGRRGRLAAGPLAFPGEGARPS